MDVLTAAWVAAGTPEHPARTPAGPGSCARCGATSADRTPIRDVVSNKFTAWDTWHDLRQAGLCAACVWGHRTSRLRSQVLLITAEPHLAVLDSVQLHTQLATPLAGDTAVSLPLRAGRKHVLPHAVWGRIAVDDTTIPWTGHDVHRLAAVARLRQLGFGTRMLTQPVPPWPQLRRIPAAKRAQILHDWASLERWRARPPWMAVGIHATTPPAHKAAA